MNNPHTPLKEFIHVEKGIIPLDLCDRIVEYIKTKEWIKHQWYDNVENMHVSEKTRELDVQHITPEWQEQLTPIIIGAGDLYTSEYAFPSEKTIALIGRFSPVRFNRYNKGQIMRQHHDHIYSLFDGKYKGIPVLSYILNFNDDYEGADLFFWKDHVIELGKGDIVMFPSLFLFPHGVTEATKGTRYSGVCWAW